MVKKESKKAKYQVEIKKEWCKSCGICVAFCPKGVFVCEGINKPVVKFSENCINCTLCIVRCPDFAVIVKENKDDTNND